MSSGEAGMQDDANRNRRPALMDVTRFNDNLKLFHGDFRDICGKYIPDNSINLIFTDPPHDRQHLCLYEALGIEGFRMLKECGSL